MNDKTLPNQVIEKDHKLDTAATGAAEKRMEHRWHWTLDESNPDRVTVGEYARAVGRNQSVIIGDAKGWAAYVLEPITYEPGKPQTPDDFRRLATMSTNRQEATKAVARHLSKNGDTQRSVSAVAQRERAKVNEVLATATQAAEKNGTTLEHEIEEAADWQAKTAVTAAKRETERKAAHSAAMITIENKIGAMLARGREVLSTAEGVDFPTAEVEILEHSIGKLRALVNLIDLSVTGKNTDVDWDTEFQKMTN